MTKLTKKEKIEKLAKKAIKENIRQQIGYLMSEKRFEETWEDYISEFHLTGNILYVSIDKSRNATPFASLSKGLYI